MFVPFSSRWAALLASGTLSVACQSNPETQTPPERAATDLPAMAAAPATDSAQQRIGTHRLLFALDSTHNTPDGMALAPNGNIILSVPNLADNSHPATLVEIVGDSLRPYLSKLPVEPSTKKAAPMDLAFGPDGHLYYAENQYENDKNFKSRLMRVRIKDGKPGAVETVADNFALANAVLWKGNTLYVTDSQWDLADNDKGSAVLRFSLDELNKGVVHLKPKTMDPHVLAFFTTKVNETGLDNGADGLDYDSQGRLYTGSFGDGTLYRLTLKSDGSLDKQDVITPSGKAIPCVDGLIIDRNTDKLYLCNSRENAIEMVDLKTNSVTTLAQNGDTDGANGLLDQPAEVLMKGNRLYIANFDKPDKNFVNTKHDAPHTVSVLDL
ncbi:SMP-30/gluconolactonase/LRE family protein [Hymenobacter koreensis]|uniref:SMP-30/gluconolactonase/LRE family protein n=1 Tax=Hymenobacter koreensis TaxID=1084523 RepID=A0ABP8J754_9BACT